MATANEIASRYAFRENEADSEATKAQRALFYAFQDAFARARPSRMARKQRDLSTAHPLHYLNITKRAFRKRKDAVLTLPADLQLLVDEQQKDGAWKATPGVVKVLEGNIGAVPRPPDGVSEWRWTTALVLVYMQRQPEHFLALRKAYEKAQRWNEDLHLRKRARNALPPLPAYFHLPQDKVHDRQWKQAQDNRMATKGYVAFTNTIRDQVAAMRARPASGRSLASRRTAGSVRTRTTHASGRTRPSTSASTSRRRSGRPRTAATSASHVSGVSGREDVGARLSSLTAQQQERQRKHLKMLEVEWKKAGDASSTLQHREEVRCFWRRKTRWGNAEYSPIPHPARITHVNDDGTANVLFLNDGRETVNNVKRRYISRAGEHGYPAPGGVKPRYLKGRYEIMADRWGGGKSMKQELAELKVIADAAAAPPSWNSRHNITRGEFSTLPKHQRKRRARQQATLRRRAARSRLPKATDLPDTTLWARQLDELASISTVLQPLATPWQTQGVANGAAAQQLLQQLNVGGEAAEEALLSLSLDPAAFQDRAQGGGDSPTRQFTARSSTGMGSPASGVTGGGGTPTVFVPSPSPTFRSARMDSLTSAFGGTTSSVGTGATSRTGGNHDLAVLAAVHEHEREVAKLLKIVLEGAKEFRLAASYGQQNTAFMPTTEQLRVVRGKAIAVVSRVRRWQRRARRRGNVGGIDVTVRGLEPYITQPSAIVPSFTIGTESPARKSGKADTVADSASVPGDAQALDGAEAAAVDGGGDNTRADGRPRTPPPRQRLIDSCSGVLPPPYYWNGREVLVTLASSLDFLQTVPELVEWYGDTYPWKLNPFATNLPLSERPPTPRKKTRLVRIGDTEMEMDAPRLVEGHKRDQQKLELYDERMFKGAPWWPGWRITQDHRARVRRAERDILLALYTSEILDKAVTKEKGTRPPPKEKLFD